jgi:hypothetical protein
MGVGDRAKGIGSGKRGVWGVSADDKDNGPGGGSGEALAAINGAFPQVTWDIVCLGVMSSLSEDSLLPEILFSLLVLSSDNLSLGSQCFQESVVVG